MSLGIKSATFQDGRIAYQPVFVPEHQKNGKTVAAKCRFTIITNSNKGHDYLGNPGRKDSFDLFVSGPLAPSCARLLKIGKGFGAICRPFSYMGRVFDANNNPILDAAGTPIEIKKIGFAVLEPNFGRDSQKLIDEEIGAGKRPVQWNIKNTPDNLLWLKMQEDARKVPFTGGPTFGNARVIIPSGQGITYNGPTGQGQPAAQGAAPATNVTQIIQAIMAAGGTAEAAAAAAVAATAATAVPATPPAPAGNKPAQESTEVAY